MEKTEPVALVDMDGTIADWHGALERDYKALVGDEKLSDGLEDRVKHLIRKQIGWYRGLHPLPLGLTIVSLLREIGFRIMILTKASQHTPNAWTEKVQWISEHLPDVDMTVTQDKGLVYGRVLVDDSPEHINRWLEWRPRGLVIVPDQPWNVEITDGPLTMKVKSEIDLIRIVPRLEEAFRRGSDS